MQGVYQIRNLNNGKIYIGSSKDIDKRWKQHIAELRKNKHHSYKLQEEWNQYGEDGFVLEVLEETETTNKYQLIEREQHYIDIYRPYIDGYNILKFANGKDYLNKDYRPENNNSSGDQPRIFYMSPKKLSKLKGKARIVYNYLMEYAGGETLILMYDEKTKLNLDHIKIEGINDPYNYILILTDKGYIQRAFVGDEEIFLYNPWVS